MTDTSAQLKSRFDRDGYLVLPGFFTPAETADLAANLDRYIRQVVPTLPPADAFYEVKGKPETLKQMHRMSQHDPYFKAFQTHERLVKLAELLLADTVVSQGVEWFNKPPVVGKATPPHQDGYYFMLEPNEAVTYWIPLDVVDESNGCLRYVPGSHRRGMRPHARTDTVGFSQGLADYGNADRAAEQPVHAKPGDVAVHHSLLVHRADNNTSARSRRALGLVYYAGRAKQDRAASEAYQKKLINDLAQAGKI